MTEGLSQTSPLRPYRDMEIKEGQTWINENSAIRIVAVSERPSSRRQGSVRVEYINPPLGRGRLSKGWIRSRYQLFVPAGDPGEFSTPKEDKG